MTVEKDIKRSLKIEKGKILVSSQVNETMNEDDFKQTYSYRYGELQQLKNQLESLKAEIRTYDGIEETEEIKKLAEQLKAAEKLKKRDEIRESIKSMEIRVSDSEKDMENFTPILSKLSKKGI